jgi:hypothetical protein
MTVETAAASVPDALVSRSAEGLYDASSTLTRAMIQGPAVPMEDWLTFHETQAQIWETLYSVVRDTAALWALSAAGDVASNHRMRAAELRHRLSVKDAE